MSLLPIYVAYVIGKTIGRFSLHIIMPALTLTLPILWATVGYYNFKHNCQESKSAVFLHSPAVEQEGFLLDDRTENYSHGRFNADNAIVKGHFKFIEVRTSDMGKIRRIYKYKNSSQYKSLATEIVPHSKSKSNYVLIIDPLRRTNSWWAPPTYTYEAKIKEIKSSNTIAKVTESLFGGGLIGRFMIKIFGDQDYEYLSCGYVSNSVGPWRPTLITRKSYEYYNNADEKFIIDALSSTK